MTPLYPTAEAYLRAPQKRVLLFGMSGLGKTHIARMLRASGAWFHYSVDYRIGTRYMGELIADDFKRHAMRVPYLRDLLLTDSIWIGSNITFENLAPLSRYLGRPGDPERGGLPFAEYRRRQEQHREAEIAALLDTRRFIARARDIYGYPHFVCDTGGSICEVVDPEDPEDPVMRALAADHLLVWIEGSEAHAEALLARFERAPKPMYYRPEVLVPLWERFVAAHGPEGRVDPDAFVRHAYRRAIAERRPRYEAMSRWGVAVSGDEVARISSPEGFDALLAGAIDRRRAEAA
jgi:hypothetical protein